MLDQVNQVLGELNRLNGDATRLVDQYCLLVQQRDGPNQPLPCIRQWVRIGPTESGSWISTPCFR